MCFIHRNICHFWQWQFLFPLVDYHNCLDTTMNCVSTAVPKYIFLHRFLNLVRTLFSMNLGSPQNLYSCYYCKTTSSLLDFWTEYIKVFPTMSDVLPEKKHPTTLLWFHELHGKEKPHHHWNEPVFYPKYLGSLHIKGFMCLVSHSSFANVTKTHTAISSLSVWIEE